MARSSGGVRTAEAIREAAAELFYQRGYEATSLRQVAAKVGIQVGSLYNHITGKDDLLGTLMIDVMDDLLSAQRAALRGRTDPVDKLVAMIDCHIRFHASCAREVFIGNSELRSLAPEVEREVVAKRDQYEGMLRAIISELAEDPRANVVNVQIQTYSIIAMGTHISTWYRPGGHYDLDALINLYTTVVLRQLDLERVRA
jgi:AcrR family transcriptional regulator